MEGQVSSTRRLQASPPRRRTLRAPATWRGVAALGALWVTLGCDQKDEAKVPPAPTATAASPAAVPKEPEPPAEEPQGPPPWSDRWSPEPGFPCEVEEVLRMSCRRCHWDPRENEAPFGMVVYDDILKERTGKPIHQLMLAMVQAELMPPLDALVEPDVEPLTEGQKSTLVAWLEKGAPKSDEICRPE